MLFRLQVWPENFGGPQPNWRAVLFVLLAGWLLANVLSLVVQAGKASGAEWVWPWSETVGVLLSNTRFGSVWLARLLISAALVGLALQTDAVRWHWLMFGLTLFALLTISLNSHAASEVEPLWPVLADWVHLIAASVWVGGLVYFVFGLWATRALKADSRAKLIGELIPRFTRLALLSVGTLTLSGVYSAILRVGAWESLFNTAYGFTLVVKIAIALVMVLIGGANMLMIPRTLAQGGAGQFQRNVSGEVYLGVLLMLSVAVLTNLPPARAAESAPRNFSSQVETEGLLLTLEVAPARVGPNEFVLTVLENGQPVNDAREVQLDFTDLSGKVPSSQVTLAGQGNGRYRFAGSNLSLPKNWQLQAAVRRDERFDVYANFNLNLGASAWLPEPRVLNAGLLFALALLFGVVIFLRTRTLRRFVLVGSLPVLGLLIASSFAFASSSDVVGPINPIPPNADSVARGQAAYTENCAMCHGQSGRGDGPIGLTLNPRPADLTIHSVPGVHTDGRLFEWISQGVPGSPMPAFEETLSEDDRWHIINYMRQVFGR
jgi:copper transport protein